MILVFGASGFLGSAVVNKLAENNKVIGVVRPNSRVHLIRPSENIEIQKREIEDWAKVIEETSPDIVVCAQWDGVGKKDRNIQEIQLANVAAIEIIAEAATNNKVKKFIAFGSQAETTSSPNLIQEEFIDSGNTWYGKSKSQIHRILRDIFKDTETKLIWARIFSVYGPNDSGESLIPAIKKNYAEGRSFELIEPNRLWSFLFIEDFSRAIEMILGFNQIYSVINIANPNLVSIKEICAQLPEAKITHAGHQVISTAGFFPVTETLKGLGWEPEVGIDEGCRITWDSIN